MDAYIGALCECCGDIVVRKSCSGDRICPWCDMGKCRYCGIRSCLFKAEFDGGRSLAEWRAHMAWHRDQLTAKDKIHELLRRAAVNPRDTLNTQRHR